MIKNVFLVAVILLKCRVNMQYNKPVVVRTAGTSSRQTSSSSDDTEQIVALMENLQERMRSLENVTQELNNLREEVMDCKDTVINLHRYEEREDYSALPDVKSDARNIGGFENMLPSGNASAMLYLQRMLAPRSCYEWRMMGFTETGNYVIDPDGRLLAEPPFTAYCDMATGSTLVHHDLESEEEATGCEGAGCYSREIAYNAKKQQIETLLEISQTCRQLIKFECHGSPLEHDDVSYSWWEDRHGNPQYYWAGAHDGVKSCACGLSRGCLDPRFFCNCNIGNPNVWLNDQGYISNKTALPVNKLYFGGIENGQNFHIRYSLGSLECFGHRSVSYPASCVDVWMSGESHTGYYYIGEPDSVSLVYCNMEEVVEGKEPTQAYSWDMAKKLPQLWDAVKDTREMLTTQGIELQTMYDRIDTLKRHHIMFNVIQTSNTELRGTVVPFNRVTLNIGLGYDQRRSLFQAPVSGIYFFAFHSEIFESHSIVRFHIRRNGVSVATAANDDKFWTSIGTTALVDLEEGDTVDVFGVSGTLDGDADGRMLFMGFLVN